MSPRDRLDRTKVVRAAAELVNAKGIEGLTLARLAERLGVQTPSLYNHVEGLPGLYRELSRLNAALLGERLGEAAIGKSGEAALVEIAQAFRRYIKENPGLYLSSLRASNNQATIDEELRTAEERIVRVVLAVIASFDLHGEEALHAVRGLRSLAHGFTTLEIAGGFGLPLDLDESYRRLVQAFIRGLGPAPDPGSSTH